MSITDRDRIILAASYQDGMAHKVEFPDVADWAIVSVHTAHYRLRGRHLREWDITPKASRLSGARDAMRACEFIVALYGAADNYGDQLAHKATLDEVLL